MIVDFTNVPVGNHVLGNVGPDGPFAALPIDPTEVADTATTGQVMQFRAGPALATDPTTPPQYLVLPAITPLEGGTLRPVALLEQLSEYYEDAPAELRLGTVANGTWTALKWEDEVTENPSVGATEIWEFYNATVDAYPMHIHEVLFQVVNRQVITVEGNWSDRPDDPLIDATNRRYSALAMLLRARYLVDVDCWSEVRGRPINPGSICNELRKRLAREEFRR